MFWLGLEAVFSVISSGMVTSDDKKDGPPGVVFALMSWLIAIGVVIILGAVAGIVWRERNLSFRAALKKLRPGPERAASHEIVTDHRAIRTPLRAPMIMGQGGNS